MVAVIFSSCAFLTATGVFALRLWLVGDLELYLTATLIALISQTGTSYCGGHDELRNLGFGNNYPHKLQAEG